MTDFVKWALWDLATNLVGYTEWLAPRRFPAAQVLKDLRHWRQTLDMIIDETSRVAETNCAHVARFGHFSVDDSKDPTRGLAGVLLGIERSWYSDRVQKYLDGVLTESRAN